jgi:hypothetical protein
MKFKKSEKLLYILLACVWFASICLDDASVFPFGVIVAVKIVKNICFYSFLLYSLLKFCNDHLNNKKFVLGSVIISIFSFILSATQSILYELHNPNSVLFALFPLYILALPLWAFIFDKKVKGDIKTPKNITLIVVLSIFILAILALNIIAIIDLSLGR